LHAKEVSPNRPAYHKSDPIQVTLKIKDQNDNAPRFSKLKYTAIVDKLSNQGMAQEILQFEVQDNDLGVYGLPGLRCFLLGDETERFIVDSAQQKILLEPCQCLLSDYKTVYNFELICKDDLGIYLQTRFWSVSFFFLTF
jgi:hypothetical protein